MIHSRFYNLLCLADFHADPVRPEFLPVRTSAVVVIMSAKLMFP